MDRSEITEFLIGVLKKNPNESDSNLARQIMRHLPDLSFDGIRLRLGRLRVQEDIEETTTHQFNEDGNEAVLRIKTSDVELTTVDSVVAFFDIDTDIWKMDKMTVKSWSTPMKLTSDKGDVPVKIPVYYIEVKFIRKAPVQHEWPVVQPILAQPVRAFSRNYPMTPPLYKALVVPDSQNGYARDIETNHYEPFHDRLAWDVVLQVAKDQSPDIIVFLGDQLDFSMYTDKFIRSPEYYFTTQPALEELHWWLSQFATTGAEMHYIEGNHEARLRKDVISNTMESYRLRPANQPTAPPALSVEGLLDLLGLGIQYHGNYPKGEYWLNDRFRLSHGNVVRNKSGGSTGAIVGDARNSEGVGHIHRAETAHKTVHPRQGPRIYGAYSFGTIARIDGVVPSNSNRHNWQQAFGVISFEPGDGMFETPHIPIISDGKVLYQGKLYTGQDHTSEISEATGWDFT